MKFGYVIKGLVVIALFVSLGYLLGDLINEDWIDQHVRNHGISGEILFVSVGVLLTGLGVSRQLIAFLGGYASGMVFGTELSMLATIGGCLLTYLVARFLARDYLLSHFSRMRRFDKFIHQYPFSMTLLLRLLPVGSNVLVNLAAGAAGVRPVPFIVGSAIGYIPQTLIFSLIGSGIGVDSVMRIGSGVILFILSGVLGFYLYRRFRAQECLDFVPAN